jgi:predicted small lipoprotein YifL
MVSDSKRAANRSRAIAAAIHASFATAALAGCGIKGPLKLPEAQAPAANAAPAPAPVAPADPGAPKPR